MQHGWPQPRRDLVATDGQRLTLGDTTLTLYLTPGHTPGHLGLVAHDASSGFFLGGDVAHTPDELAEAERWNDPERAARLQAEEDALAHELAAAIGLGGRDRAAVSASERARVSVTRATGASFGIGSGITPTALHSAGAFKASSRSGPVKIDAVWPSSPMPSQMRSSGQ